MDKYELINKIKKLDGLTDDEKSALLGMLRTHKKYGLVWEDKPEAVEEEMKIKLPVLTEVKERAIINDTETEHYPNHVIIEGDNLHAEVVLDYVAANSIDVIYIDPPYNTGNKDFVYNDKYVDSEDSYRHSKWLSFMSKRLMIARKLLSDSGFICISIDDNEQAVLKLLCDEVFGYLNYINTISVKAKASSGASGGGEDKKLKKNIEYVLIYAKRRECCDFIFPLRKTPLIELIEEKREEGKSWLYTNIMYKEGNKTYIGSTKAGNGEEIELYKVTDYEIKSVSDVMKLENISEEDVYNKYIDKIFTTENAQTSIRQRVKDAVGQNDDYFIARYKPVSGRNKGKTIEVGFIGSTKRLVSFLKVTCLVEKGKVYKLEKIGTLWDDLSWSSISGEGGVSFPSGKKPIALIERLISMHPNKNAQVLDFFAGSASTGHAVIDLNKQDQGKRRVIISTNNTEIDNYICETVAYPRMKNVICGFNKTAKKYVEGFYHNNLRYYKTDFVGRERTVKNMRALVDAATDMLCIKEDMYKEVDSFGTLAKLPRFAVRHFSNGSGRDMLIIYDETVIPDLVDIIYDMEMQKPIKIYVFSPNRNPYTDEFEDVEEKVELCALPAAIYDAYREVIPPMEDKELKVTDNTEVEEDKQ